MSGSATKKSLGILEVVPADGGNHKKAQPYCQSGRRLSISVFVTKESRQKGERPTLREEKVKKLFQAKIKESSEKREDDASRVLDSSRVASNNPTTNHAMVVPTNRKTEDTKVQRQETTTKKRKEEKNRLISGGRRRVRVMTNMLDKQNTKNDQRAMTTTRGKQKIGQEDLI